MSDSQTKNYIGKISETLELEVVYKNAISYLDYQNGHSAVAGFSLKTQGFSGENDRDFTVEIQISAMGELFSTVSSTEMREITSDTPFAKPLGFKLAPNQFLKITDTVVGELEVSVFADGNLIFTGSTSVDLLPLGLWIWKDGLGRVDLSNLASFSLPNNKAIAPLLDVAARKMGEKGFNPHLIAYQWDNETQLDPATIRNNKLLEIQSIYEAAQTLDLSYSNPPFGYDEQSQRIRTPSEIVEAKSATCLDSALLMSSLMEAAGYFTILAVVPGHAFVGAWLRQNDPLPDFVCNIGDVINLVGNEIVLFETTTICASSRADFAEAQSRVAQYANIAEIQKAVASFDQSELRRQRYRLVDVTPLKLQGWAKPLPERVVASDGSVSVFETEFKAVFGSTADRGANENPSARQLVDDSPARIKTWKEGLLDLTFRNPLLAMSDVTGRQLKKGGIRILPPSDGPGVIEDLLQERDASGKPRSLKLVSAPVISRDGEKFEDATVDVRFQAVNPEAQSVVDSSFGAYKHLHTNVSKEDLGKRLKKLAREARTTFEETGTNSLYITFGSLTWQRPSGWGSASSTWATSPLLLLPVSITALNRGQEFEISIDDTNAIATNETLAIKILNDYGVDLPKLREPDLDHSGFDVAGLIKHVSDVLAKTKHNDWRVNPDCTIGFYDFSTYHQWKDLNDNWRKLKESPLVEHLVANSQNSFIDPASSCGQTFDLDLETSRVPIDTDQSQIEAIAKSLNGESFVIQGPPGTGKSQTITNLLARNMQAGRRVLFVCEKAAALEVVKRRLDTIGLGEFVLDLHGTKTKPATVRSRLMAALELSPDGDRAGFDTAKYDHDQALNSLTKYPERLHNANNEFEISVYDARDKYLTIDSSSNLTLTRQLLNVMKAKEKQAFTNTWLTLGDVGEIAGTAKTNVWSLSNLTPDQLTTERKEKIRKLVSGLPALLEQLLADAEGRQIVEQLANLTDPMLLATMGNDGLLSGPKIEMAITSAAAARFFDVTIALKKFINYESKTTFNDNLLAAPVEQIRSNAQAVAEAGFFGRNKKLKGFIFSISPYLVDSSQIDKTNYQSTLEAISNRHAYASRIRDEVLTLTDLIQVSSSFNPLDDADCNALFAEIEKVKNLKVFIESITESARQPVIKILIRGDEHLINRLSELGTLLEQLFTLLETDDASFKLWTQERKLATAVNQCATSWLESATSSDFRSLTQWGKLIELLEPLKATGQLEARNQTLEGKIEYKEAPRAFERSYYELVFAKLLEDNNLGNFEGRSYDSTIKSFGEASHRLKGFTRSTMAEEILKVRTFDGKAGVGKAGSLRAELNKRTNQMPVRRLMKTYWDTITEITPCVAASPDSVARFLDVDFAKFDLVVFDEASQIRVSTAIGALGRAKSAIIVGDSKQMPPTAFFAIGSRADDELSDSEVEEIVRDEESILSEAVRSQIPSLMLSWHYRSQDEALIAFSNKEYYDGRLSSFPSPTEALDSKGVKWSPVKNGQYFRKLKTTDLDEAIKNLKISPKERKRLEGFTRTDYYNTNPVEAIQIVDEVTRRFEDPELMKQSLGIVTMNEQQRKLIEFLLDEVKNDALQEARKSEVTEDYLFVRALEKVQGDERDVIFMSIGFSRASDKKVPMNFGPLSRVGGERRLNVAITRARVQVVVFCSFEPNDLEVRDTTAQGMRDLQNYMRMAKEGPRAIGLGNGGRGRPSDRHRSDIASALSARGYNVTQDVGLSGFRIDIVVSHPEDPSKRVLGIMLDGRDWNLRQTAADREVLPLNFLQRSMGWPAVERIWLPTWMRDRNGELDRIEATIKAIADASTDLKKTFDLPDFEKVTHKKADGDEDSTAPLTIKGQVGVDISDIGSFVALNVRHVHAKTDLNYLDNRSVREAISQIAKKLTDIEGPVSPGRFVAVVARSFGLTGVKSEKASIIPTIPQKTLLARDTEGFLFPVGVKPADFITWRQQTAGENIRDLQDISLAEISNCMRDLCARVHGMAEAELMKQTSLAFGFLRVGANANERLSKAISLGTKRGILRLEDGLILGVQ